MARLKEQYVNEIAPALNSKFGYKSVMQIPKLDKVVINVACGEAKENENTLGSCSALTVISGPTPAGSPIVMPKILRMAASFSKGRCHGRFAVPCAGRPIPPGTNC